MKATGIQLSADDAMGVAQSQAMNEIEKEKEKEKEKEREKEESRLIDHFSDIPFLDYRDDPNIDDDDDYNSDCKWGRDGTMEVYPENKAIENMADKEDMEGNIRRRRRTVFKGSVESSNEDEETGRGRGREREDNSSSSRCSSHNSNSSSAKLSSTSNISPSSSFNNSITSSSQSTARKNRPSDGSPMCAIVTGQQVSKAMQDLKLLEQMEDAQKKAGRYSIPSAGVGVGVGGESRFDLQADAHVRLGSVTGRRSRSSKHKQAPKDFGAAVGCLSLFPSLEPEHSVLLDEDLRPIIYLMSQSSGFTVKNKFVSEDQLKQFLAPSSTENYLP